MNRFTKNIRAYLQAERIAPFLTETTSDADCARHCDAFTRLSECDRSAIRAHYRALEPAPVDLIDADESLSLMEILGID